MSSKYVRDQFKNFINTELATENLIDLTGEYSEINDMLSNHGLTYESDWLGVQFSSSQDAAVNIGADNDSGCYRELGTLFIHIVAMASGTAVDNILNRAENIRDKFRGKRINDIVIESVSPANFESGTTLEFEGGFTSASILVGYYRDLNL